MGIQKRNHLFRAHILGNTYSQYCLFYAYVCMPECMYVQAESPGIGIIDGCELLYEHWEENLGPLQKR